jgi:hypothetical protein
MIGWLQSPPRDETGKPDKTVPSPPLQPPVTTSADSIDVGVKILFVIKTQSQPKTFGMFFSPMFSVYSAATALLASIAYAASNGSPVTPDSPTSSVAGRAFDRFVIITLENTVSHMHAQASKKPH